MLDFSQCMGVIKRRIVKGYTGLNLVIEVGSFFIQMVQQIGRVKVRQLTDIYEYSFVLQYFFRLLLSLLWFFYVKLRFTFFSCLFQCVITGIQFEESSLFGMGGRFCGFFGFYVGFILI